jgi:septin family protein
LSEPNEERKKEIREAIKQENIKQYRKKSDEEDEHEELIDLDVNQL